MVNTVGKNKRYPLPKDNKRTLASTYTPDEFETILADIKYEREHNAGIKKKVYICKPNNNQHHD